MAGPVRIAILANGSQARREFTQTAASGTAMGRKFSGVAGLLKGGLVAGAAAAAYGVAALGKSAVQTEAQFSQSMNLIRAATDAPAARMSQLNDLAIKLGNDTAFSANDAADAMLELAKAGLTTKQIMGGGVAGTLTLAAAGGTELGTAATIASNAMNAFNLQGRDMGKIAAALAGGANASSASVESLGQGLAQVGPGATNAGLSLQETVAALSAFDAAGIKGSDAGTSLKTMLARLVPQTEAASSAMADLGLDFTKSNGEFVNITDVADQLQQKLGKLNAEQRAQALQTIFGSDATRAATVLYKDGASGIQEYIDAANDQGAAEKVAKARMEGTQGALEKLSGAVDTAKLQIGQGLAPAVEAGADALSNAISAVSGFGDALRKAQDAPNGTGDTILAQLTDSSRDALDALEPVKKGFADGFGEIGESVSEVLRENGPMIRRLTDYLGDAFDVISDFGGGAVGGYIKTTLDGIGEGFEALAAGVKFAGNVFFDFTDIVVSVASTAVEQVTGMTSAVLDSFIKIAEAVDAIPGGPDLEKTIDTLEGYRDGVTGFGEEFKSTSDKLRAQLEEQQYLWNLTDKQASEYRNVLLALPAEVKTILTTPGAIKSYTDVQQLARQYDLTADEVTTVIRSEGVNLSLAQMRQLARRYDMNPKQVRTLFKTQGIDASLSDLSKLQKKYGLNPKRLSTTLRLLGTDITVRDIQRVQGELKRTDKTKVNMRGFVGSFGDAMVQATERAKSGGERIKGGLEKGPSSAKMSPAEYLASIAEATSDARGRAATGGNQVGGALKSGALAGVGGLGPALSAALAASVRAAIAAGKRAARSNSPSKETEELGKALSDGLVLGLTARGAEQQAAGKNAIGSILAGLTSGSAVDNAIDRLEKALDKRLSDAKLKAVLKSIRDEEAAIRKQGKALDANNKKLEAAQAKLKSLVQAAKQYAQGIKDSIVAFGSITSVGGDGGVGSVDQLIAGLEGQAATAAEYSALIRQLTKAGLNQTTIQQLLDAGVEGGLGTAQTIASGGAAAIAQINALTQDLTQTGGALGNAMSNAFNQAGIDAAQGIVDGLLKKRKALRKVMAGLADDLIDALRKRLDSHSPSRAMASVGQDAVDGLVLGLDDTHVRRQGQRLADALRTGYGDPTLKATVAGGSSAPIRVEATVRLTAEEFNALRRGREITIEASSYRNRGGRRTRR